MGRLIGLLNLSSGLFSVGGWLEPGVDLQQVCPVVDWLVVVEVASLAPVWKCRCRTRALPFWIFFWGGHLLRRRRLGKSMWVMFGRGMPPDGYVGAARRSRWRMADRHKLGTTSRVLL